MEEQKDTRQKTQFWFDRDGIRRQVQVPEDWTVDPGTGRAVPLRLYRVFDDGCATKFSLDRGFFSENRGAPPILAPWIKTQLARDLVRAVYDHYNPNESTQRGSLFVTLYSNYALALEDARQRVEDGKRNVRIAHIRSFDDDTFNIVDKMRFRCMYDIFTMMGPENQGLLPNPPPRPLSALKEEWVYVMEVPKRQIIKIENPFKESRST